MTGTATISETSASDRSPRDPSERQSAPSGLISAQAQKLPANPRVATATITQGFPARPVVVLAFCPAACVPSALRPSRRSAVLTMTQHVSHVTGHTRGAGGLTFPVVDGRRLVVGGVGGADV